MRYAAIPLVVLALAATACGQKEQGAPAVAAQPSGQTMQEVPKAPPPPVAPDVPPGATPELPRPGQANDHSSPAFKADGASEPQR